MRAVLLALVALLLVLPCASALDPENCTVRLYPDDDAYTYYALSAPWVGDVNYGSSPDIAILNDYFFSPYDAPYWNHAYLKYGYVHFNLSQLGNLSSDVLEVYDATLYLYKHDQIRWYSGQMLDVCRIDSTWDEDAITWNNQPDETAVIAETPDPNSVNVWVSWNITEEIAGIVNGTYANNGWSIRPFPRQDHVGGCTPIFYSKEGSEEYKPYLEIHYLGYPISLPTASFTWKPTTPYNSTFVRFTDTSTGENIQSWYWDFGDGYTSTEQNPTHMYATAGTYNVSLTVSNPRGDTSHTETITIITRENGAVPFWSSWSMMFGSATIAVLTIIGLLAFLCVGVGMDVAAAIVVMLPTLWGVAESETFPAWFRALIIIPIGVLWGLALMRTMRGA